MKEPAARSRARRVEDRLRLIRGLRLDPAEVRASRQFHFRHWMKLAEAAIRRDHAGLYYRGLADGVEALVADIPEDPLTPETQAAVLRDLAFMEGHLQALRDAVKALRKAAADQG